MRNIAIVAAEQLVAAVARQHHGDVAARHLRDVPRRDRRRIGEWLVEVRHQIVENRDGVRLDDELVVVGAEMLRDQARVLQLVERRLVEADREGLHARAGGLRHQADHHARVDAAGEKRAERHVADQMRGDGAGQHVAQLLDGVGFRSAERLFCR